MTFHVPPQARRALTQLSLEMLAAEALELAGIIEFDVFEGVTTTDDRRERLRPIFAPRARDLFPPDYRITYAEVWHAVYGEQLLELPRSSQPQPQRRTIRC